jgi:hypothetical protein
MDCSSTRLNGQDVGWSGYGASPIHGHGSTFRGGGVQNFMGGRGLLPLHCTWFTLKITLNMYISPAGVGLLFIKSTGVGATGPPPPALPLPLFPPTHIPLHCTWFTLKITLNIFHRPRWRRKCDQLTHFPQTGCILLGRSTPPPPSTIPPGP